MKIRLPKELCEEMKSLTKTLNDSYTKLMEISATFNEFANAHNVTEETVHEDDLEIVETLEEVVDKFSSL